MNAMRSSRRPLTGRLVRLTAYNPEKDAESFAHWSQNSEYQQLLDSSPAVPRSQKSIQEWMEKPEEEAYRFSIHTLEGDQAIGFCSLESIAWASRDAWVAIGIGEREYWGKGYGSDAMNEILRFAFETLNLRRVSLNVFGYNERAQKSYLKVGFKVEGRQRQWMVRSGIRYDLIFMGILREEWEARQALLAAQDELSRQKAQEP